MSSKITRRQFVGGAVGIGVAASLGGATRAFGRVDSGGRLVPRRTLGIQQFSIRDAITRRGIANSQAAGVAPTMGFLGGPTFPADPNDLGPLVPLPGGFAEVFEYLASVGYDGIEFFSFSQGVNGAITNEQLRAALDDAGLACQGSHTGSLGNMFDPATNGLSANGRATLDQMHVLGAMMLGTAGDPSGRTTLEDNPTNPNQIGWAEAARRADIVGAATMAEGVRYYFHPEQNTFRFFDPVANPQLADVHLIQWFTDNTDRNLVHFTPDILHAYSGAARFPHPVNGIDFDPFKWARSDPSRFIGYHLKDGSPNPTWSGPPNGGPYVQTVVRTATITDAMPALEGALGQGHPAIERGFGSPTLPDYQATHGFGEFIHAVKHKNTRMHMVESDSGPGGSSDPGRSLRHAKLSAKNLLGL